MLAIGVSALAFTAPAHAAITGSQVTKPTDPRFLVYNQNNPNTFVVEGTTSGGNPATDKVDVLCFYDSPAPDHPAVAENVSLAGDGSFSVPAADLGAIQDRLCRLRAVPAGFVPANLTPFKGPVVGGDSRWTKNDGLGHDFDFSVWAGQLHGNFFYTSLTANGLFATLIDASLFTAVFTYSDNAWLASYDDFDNIPSSTRSEVRIDGDDAYGPGSANGINNSAPGYPELTYDLSIDPLTGKATIHESDELVRCPLPTYPPDATSCDRFRPTGVKDKRTIVQDHAGRLSRVTDVFKSTDGEPHDLSLLWQNSQRFIPPGNSYNPTTVRYRFPGQSQYFAHAYGDVVQLPQTHPASIFIKNRGARGGGAIVYDRTAKDATFNVVDLQRSGFYLRQHAVIGPDDSVKFRFAYVQALNQTAVNTLAQKVKNDFK
jgi:hypothetical protein